MTHSKICDGIPRYFIPDMGFGGCYCSVRGMYMSCVRYIQRQYPDASGHAQRSDLVPLAISQRNMLRLRRKVVESV